MALWVSPPTGWANFTDCSLSEPVLVGGVLFTLMFLKTSKLDSSKRGSSQAMKPKPVPRAMVVSPLLDHKHCFPCLL